MKQTIPSDSDPVDPLLAECRFETFRASGPGGQKRNKTSSAVRVTHITSGLSAIANESRSQAKNKQQALERLRLRMALELRQPIEAGEALLAETVRAGRIDLARGSAQFLPVLSAVLDVLHDAGWSVSDAANSLGISTGQLVSFLKTDLTAWAKVNQMRQERDLRPLR